jgi:hypothetical protein
MELEADGIRSRCLISTRSNCRAIYNSPAAYAECLRYVRVHARAVQVAGPARRHHIFIGFDGDLTTLGHELPPIEQYAWRDAMKTADGRDCHARQHLASTKVSFSLAVYRRRRSRPVMISTRLGSVCIGLSLGAGLASALCLVSGRNRGRSIRRHCEACQRQI